MSTLTATTPIVRHPSLVAAEMDGDLVMMSVERGEYYGVSGVGPRIWELLEHPVTIEQMAAILCAEFAVDEADCTKDLLDFTGELLDMGLVQTA